MMEVCYITTMLLTVFILHRMSVREQQLQDFTEQLIRELRLLKIAAVDPSAGRVQSRESVAPSHTAAEINNVLEGMKARYQQTKTPERKRKTFHRYRAADASEINHEHADSSPAVEQGV